MNSRNVDLLLFRQYYPFSWKNILAIETTLFDIAQKNDCNYEGFGSYGN